MLFTALGPGGGKCYGISARHVVKMIGLCLGAGRPIAKCPKILVGIHAEVGEVNRPASAKSGGIGAENRIGHNCFFHFIAQHTAPVAADVEETELQVIISGRYHAQVQVEFEQEGVDGLIKVYQYSAFLPAEVNQVAFPIFQPVFVGRHQVGFSAAFLYRVFHKEFAQHAAPVPAVVLKADVHRIEPVGQVGSRKGLGQGIGHFTFKGFRNSRCKVVVEPKLVSGNGRGFSSTINKRLLHEEPAQYRRPCPGIVLKANGEGVQAFGQFRNAKHFTEIKNGPRSDGFPNRFILVQPIFIAYDLFFLSGNFRLRDLHKETRQHRRPGPAIVLKPGRE